MRVRILINDGDETEVDLRREYDIRPPKAAFGLHPADAPTPGFATDEDAIFHLVDLAISAWKELT